MTDLTDSNALTNSGTNSNCGSNSPKNVPLLDLQSYFLMYKNSPVMVHSLNSDNLICEVNDKWLREMGYCKDEVIGTHIEDYMCEDSRKFAREVILPQLWKTGNISGVNHKFVTKNKKHIDLLLSCSVIETKTGPVSISVMQNITEQIKLNDELRRMASKLEELNLIKSHFVSNLGYEFRTPMTNIMGFADMLCQTQTTPEQQKLITHIKTSSSSLFSTISSLLEYSRLESNETILESNEFSFKKLIYETINLMMEKAEQKSIKIFYSVDSNLKNNLIGDESKIKLIILNLIDNAVKFSSKGEVKIKLSVTSETDENILVNIEVSDQGIGISKDHIDNIFLPFYQVDEGFTRKHHGIGLGLTIANHYAKIMGGEKICVKSSTDGGSIFNFSIYLTKASRQKKTDDPLQSETAKQDYRIGRKILIVEDNYLNVEVICRLLKICECEFKAVDNGLKALELIKNSEKFDAILMDINLPEMSGIETSKKIRALGCQIPIIAVTAYTSANDKMLCINAGMNDYLTKPINFNLLVNSIKTHCKCV